METSKIIEALEELNMEYIVLSGSKEVEWARERIRLQNKLAEGILWYPAARIRRKRALSKIPGKDHPVNWNEKQWKSLMHEGDPNKKYVVYSCITGGYDRAQKPTYYSDHCDYIMFLNSSSEQSINGWTVQQIPKHIMDLNDNSKINRYIKMHPSEMFGGKYDFAIYIDGNVKPITDLSVLCELINGNIGIAVHHHCHKDNIYDEIRVCNLLKKGNTDALSHQGQRYRNEGFPEHFGMAECNVIVTDLKSGEANKILGMWWEEFIHSNSGRDQISLPYVLWKTGHKMEEITTLGDNVFKNPKIQFCSHEQ